MYYNDINSFPLSAEVVWGSPLENPTNSTMVYMKILPHDPSYVESDEGPEYSYTSADGTTYCLVATLENGSDKDIANSQLRCSDLDCSVGDNGYVVCPD
jgi:hypothetical protein